MDGKVINSGTINASLGGDVTLLGKQVQNDGLISAKLGSVNLTAGKEAVLTFDDTGLVGIRVTKEVLQEEIGIDPAVMNNGQIHAEGGQVLLTASVSQDVFSQAVNTNGLDQATSVVVHPDGTFTLGGGADVVNTGSINVSKTTDTAKDPNVARIVLIGENVTSSGVIRADNTNGNGGEIELHANSTMLLTDNSYTSARSETNGTGGTIKVLGNNVGLFDQSSVDVSGDLGGGQALIGGDYQGKNGQIRNASRTYVGAGVSLYADALTEGNGGTVINWADDATWFYGSAYARGGSLIGDGGLIEISGKLFLDFHGTGDTFAVNGTTGTVLLDPTTIEIRAGTGDGDDTGSENNLLTNTNVAWGDATPTIIYESELEGLSNTNIVLQAADGITINNLTGGTEMLLINNQNGFSISFVADGNSDGVGDFIMADTANDTLATMGGSINISGVNVTTGFIDTSSVSNTPGGAVTINATGTVDVVGIDTRGDAIGNSAADPANYGGAVNITANGTVTVGTIDTRGGSVGDNPTSTVNSFGGAVTVNTSGLIDITTIDTRGGDVGNNNVSNVTDAGTNLSNNGGAVQLTTSGAVTLGTINTTGGGVGNDTDNGSTSNPNNVGGSVTITASGDVDFTQITSKGGAVGDDTLGRNGGAVNISGFDLTVGIINTSGSDSGGDNDFGQSDPGAGTAGTITLTAGNDVFLNNTITANGGNGPDTTFNNGDDGHGGNGALITIDAQQDIIGNSAAVVSSNGGNGPDADDGDGGNGGGVTLIAGRNIQLSAVVSSNGGNGPRLDGGSNNDGHGGDAGAVSLTATQDIILNSGATINSNGGAAHESSGFNGGTANTITLTTQRNITLNANLNAVGGANVGGGRGTDGVITLQGAAGNFNNIITISNGINIQGHTNSIIDGNGGNDTLISLTPANTWTINNTDAGSLNNGTATIAFREVENLTGGSAKDTFNLNAGTITGLIDGGTSDQDELNIALNSVTVQLGNRSIDAATLDPNLNVDNIETITANAAGTDNKIIGDNVTNYWTIDGTNSVSPDAPAQPQVPEQVVAFNNFHHVTGGTGDDHFYLDAGAGISGMLDGAEGGGNDTLTINVTGITVELGQRVDAVSNTNFNVDNLETITSTVAGNTIQGDNIANTWTIDGGATETVAPTAAPSDPNLMVTFSGFDNLTGGDTSADTFNISVDFAGIIRGGGVSTETGTSNDVFNINVASGSTYTGTLLGGDGNDSFTIANTGVTVNNTIDGGAGTDTLTAANEDNYWLVQNGTSDGAGGGIFATSPDRDIAIATPPGTPRLTFDNMNILNGNDAIDDVMVQSTSLPPVVITGGAGANTVDFSAITNPFVLQVGATGFNGFDIYVGNDLPGTTVIAEDGVTNTWSIGVVAGYGNPENDGINDGTIFNGSTTFRFLDFPNLQGGDGTDNFIVNSGGSLTGLADGLGGTNTLNTTAIVGMTVELGDRQSYTGGATRIHVANVSTVTANAGLGNTIVGDDDAANNWAVTGANTGTVDGTTFINFDSMVGNSGNDIFQLHLTFDFAGTIDGGAGGTDRIVAADRAVNSWTISGASNGSVTGLGGTFTGIEELHGGSQQDIFQLASVAFNGSIDGMGGDNDELRGGVNVDNVWVISGARAGTVTNLGAGFDGIEILTGNNFSDIFQLHDTIDFVGSIDGGTGGLDEIIGGTRTIDNLWSITGPNSGTVQGVTLGFSQIETITGGGNRDVVQLHNTIQFNGSISGGGGANDELIAGNRSTTWRIIGAGNTGRVTGILGSNTFTAFETLTGSDNTDFLYLHATESFNGAFNANGGTNAIFGNTDRPVTNWTISTPGGGTVDGLTSFSSITHLIGGANSADTFTIQGTGSVSGYVHGSTGTGVIDTVDISAMAGNFDIAIQHFGGDLSAYGIESFIGGDIDAGGPGHRLIGQQFAATNTWTIIAGTNDGTYSDGFSTATFTNFANLQGGAYDDDFTFNNGATLTGIINGDDVSGSPSGFDKINMSAVGTWDVTIGQDFVNIEEITGNGANSALTGSNTQNTWTIQSVSIDGGGTSDGVNDGTFTVNGSGQILTFINFADINGGTGDDNFALADGSSFTGTIDGGESPGDNDTIDYSAITTAENVQLVPGSGSFNGITNLEGVIGNAENPLATGYMSVTGFNGQDNEWTINGVNSGVIEPGTADQMTFQNFIYVIGGDQADTFTVTGSGSVAGSISGGVGNGNDNLIVQLDGTNINSVTFNGGNNTATGDTLTVTSSAGNYVAVFNPAVGGYDQLVYTNTDNSAQFTVNYVNTETVTDNSTAELVINGTAANDTISLDNTSFNVNTAVSGINIDFSNKSLVTADGLGINDTDVLLLTGNYSLPGLVVRTETLNTQGNSITVNALTLDGLTVVGSIGSPLDVSVVQLNILNSGPVYINDIAGDLDLGTLSTTSPVGISTAGNLTASDISSVSDVTLAGNDITLSGTTDITGILTLNATNVTLSDAAAAIDIAGTITGTLDAATNGFDITMNGDFNVINVSNAGIVTISDIDRVNLNSIVANSVLSTSNGVDLGAVTATTTVSIDAGAGNISDTNGASVNIIADAVILKAGSGIGTFDEVTPANSQSIGTETANLTVENNLSPYVDDNSVINITNTNIAGAQNVTVHRMVNTGNIYYKNDGDVVVDNIDAGFTVGHLSFEVNNGSVFGTPNRSLQLYQTQPDITANTALILVNDGVFGTVARPISLYIRSELRLFSQVSVPWFYLNHVPPLFEDSSVSTLAVFDFGLGQQMIEIESLAEIDPAIFSAVKNYIHDEIAIKLPDDQRYTEEENKEERSENTVN
ncbi:MAG: hypothetical protein OEZ39_12900 [Gammaproteobacteria bacterium]|nr:hypothetical protein [Gammaproteobacteria bacterium]